MMKLGLHICESRDGNIILDCTDDAQDVIATTGDHGFDTLSFFMKMGSEESFQYYNLPGVPYCGLFEGGDPVWEGRVEDIAIVDGGINVVAFGYWSALNDAPYTALWSCQSYADCQQLNSDDISAALPDRWTLDNNNRLYFAPNNGETFGSSEAVAYWGKKRPDKSEKYILEVDFSYDLTAASPWKLQLYSYQDGWASATQEWTLTGNGSSQTGSTSVTLTGSNVTAVAFRMIYDSTATAYTGDTGDTYGKITSARVKAVTTATVTAKVIIEDLVSFISNLNGEIPNDYTSIFDPNVDLDDAVYLDRYPAEIISELALIGDDSTPPKLYERTIWEGGYLHFHEIAGYDSFEWFTDVESLELERSLQGLVNSYYVLYDSGKQRTATGSDLDSIAIHGIIRRGFSSATTTSQTQAEIIRDANLECTCGRPRASVQIAGLYDKRGGEYRYFRARAGDRMTLRNLNPDLGELDNVRTFVIDTTEFNLKTNQLIITPQELPNVALIAAQGNMI